MKKNKYSTPVFIVGLTVLVASAIVYLKNYKATKLNQNEYAEASSVSWQPKEQCVSQPGHWEAPDASCRESKWLGDKPDAKDICCVAPTEQDIEDLG